MDPPVPAAQGKGSWAGSPGVALPGAPDRWAGCTGGCGAAWGWSSGALPGGVLACGCPVRMGLGSPWPLLLPAASPSSICSASALSRARPAPAGRVQLPGLWGPRGRSPPVPFPLLSPSLEGPRPGTSTGTPSGRGAPSPQSPGSPVPQGSAGPHACRTAGHQAGDGTAVHGHVRLGVCGLRGTLGPCPVPPLPSAALASPPGPSRCGQGQTRWPCSVSAVGPGLEPVEGQAVRSSGEWGQRPPPPPGSRNRRGDGKRGRGSQRQGRWLAARGPPSGTSVCGARQMPGLRSVSRSRGTWLGLAAAVAKHRFLHPLVPLFPVSPHAGAGAGGLEWGAGGPWVRSHTALASAQGAGVRVSSARSRRDCFTRG